MPRRDIPEWELPFIAEIRDRLRGGPSRWSNAPYLRPD
jgi:hypothetical protein